MSNRQAFSLAASLFVFSLTSFASSGQNAPGKSPAGPDLAELARSTAPAPPPTTPTPTLAKLIGSCDAGSPINLDDSSLEAGGGRPVGPLSTYTALLQIAQSDSGFVRARANAVWDASDLRNLLGLLRSGSYVWAEGPLHDNRVSAGIGYAVPVRDQNGRECRAYVSGLNVIPLWSGGPISADALRQLLAKRKADQH
jgi:hypothetical protein